MSKISVIIPVYNGEKWIDECLSSVSSQKLNGSFEISIFNDSSSDDTDAKLKFWKEKCEQIGIRLIYSKIEDGPKGVGFAKNMAVRQSYGDYLCFQDIDDIMLEGRLQKQLASAEKNQNAIVGSKFERKPLDSTSRYTKWANNIRHDKLTTQVYTSHGPTIIMPTWFCSRELFNGVGGFCEDGQGTPEDLIFFYQHLNAGGAICRIDESLVIYRYHPLATTFSIHENTIFSVRMEQLESRVLNNWSSFTIWNAGKLGRKFYRSLSEDSRSKVSGFCDVDFKKIDKQFYVFEECDILPKPKVPIMHFTEASPPFVICVKLDLTHGEFEKNLCSLNIIEGIDYILFT